MASDPQKVAVTIAPGSWGDASAYWIEQALDADAVPSVRAQVDAGIASLFSVRVDGEDVGAFVCRIDRFPTHAEGVIMAGAACMPGIDIIATIVPEIEKKFIGCAAVRYHTGRVSLAKRMAKLGYVPDEIICRKSLNHG